MCTTNKTLAAGELAASPVWWGYVLPAGLPSSAMELLDGGRLALVLDLDETLLGANSLDTLERRAADARRVRCGVARGRCLAGWGRVVMGHCNCVSESTRS
jgi:hypothetical protein